MPTLEEKREIKKAQDTWLPEKTRELTELSGGPAVIEVLWDSFSGDLKALEWLEFNGPQQVVNAYRVIGTDDLGKEALRTAVKKIVFKNVSAEGDKRLEFADGVLSVSCAFAKSPGGRFTSDQVREFIVPKL